VINRGKGAAPHPGAAELKMRSHWPCHAGHVFPLAQGDGDRGEEQRAGKGEPSTIIAAMPSAATASAGMSSRA